MAFNVIKSLTSSADIWIISDSRYHPALRHWMSDGTILFSNSPEGEHRISWGVGDRLLSWISGARESP
ncbi:hypothetical protein CEXT_468241 [Caerostris extrusa]|uniref:Uncharacterized protein n=1 Tax=Caerostris extrusa TaxID=172846 RepID=A0AAV4R1Z4_CAEEX|nr:hypothetical protein CEXT_468241 [Caerostris extrusa]